LSAFDVNIEDDESNCLFLFTGKLKHVAPAWVFASQVKYVDDDSTIFWAVGPDQSVLASRVEHCGKDVELTIPLENATSGEVYSAFFLRSLVLYGEESGDLFINMCWHLFKFDISLGRRFSRMSLVNGVQVSCNMFTLR